MGSRGPVPKRSDQRRRRNAEPNGKVTKAPAGAVVAEIPEAEADWLPIVRETYLSFAMSGQSRFYEPSDWQLLRLSCHLANLQVGAEKPSAVMWQVINGMWSDLLATEGERRRARMELERTEPTAEDPAITIMAKYRRAAGAK